MANIMRADYRVIKSSDAERVMQVYNEREISRRALMEDFELGLQAWKYYFARSGDQWPSEKLAQLTEQKRYPYQFNILTPKVNTMAGTMITDLPDPDWMPVEGMRTTGTEAIKSSYSNDKEITNWESALIEVIKGGLVHSSWVQMVETKKYHPLGNIGLEHVQEGSFIPSAYWITQSDRDLKEGWKSTWITPDGLAHKFPEKKGKIAFALQAYKKNRSEIPKNLPEQQQTFEGRIGDEFEVIEDFWLEIVEKKRLVGKKTGQLLWVPFPLTENDAEINEFAEINEIDWDTVDLAPYEDIICHRTVIAPSLDPTLIFFDGKSRIQCKGLPFFNYTTQRHKGRNKGLVETIIDLQSTLNERVSLETELIAKANGGSTLYNENLFTDEAQKRRFNERKNVPGHAEFVDLDAVERVREEIGPNQYPSQILSQIELIYKTLLPLVSGVSEAWSSESTSQDSGVLYARKVQMNKIATLVYDKQLKQLVNNLGEAYVYQWQITYGDSEREIRDKKGQPLILNERLDGEGTIRNAVQYIPRVTVIVTENTISPLKQTKDREVAGEMLRNINPELNPLMWHDFAKIFIMSLDRSEEEKIQLQADLELERAAAQTSLIARIAQASAGVSIAALQGQQAQMSLGQMGVPSPQPVAEQVIGPEQQIQRLPPKAKAESEAGAMTESNLLVSK